MYNVALHSNYGEYFRALFYLDCILTGTKMHEKQNVLKSDVGVIKRLMQSKIGELTVDEQKCPKYIDCTFQSFVNQKDRIVINLHFVNEYFNGNGLSELIVMKQQKLWKLNCDLLKLFDHENIRKIVFYTTDQNGIIEYPMDLLSLLSSLSFVHGNLHKIRIHATHNHVYDRNTKTYICQDNDCWIEKLFASNAHNVKQQFDRKQWNLSVNSMTDGSGYQRSVCCLKIDRKMF